MEKYELLKDKFSNICSRPVHRKPQIMLTETEDLKKWKLDYVHGLKDLKLLTCQFSPMWSIDSTKLQSNSDSGLFFFKPIDRVVLKLILKCKVSRRAKTILKKNKSWRIQDILQNFSNHDSVVLA